MRGGEGQRKENQKEREKRGTEKGQSKKGKREIYFHNLLMEIKVPLFLVEPNDDDARRDC